MSVGSVGGGEAKGGLVYEKPMYSKHAESSAPAGPPAKTAAPPPLVSAKPQAPAKADGKNHSFMA